MPGSDFCVFHSQTDYKRTFEREFENEFIASAKDANRIESPDFRGFVFPRDFKLTSKSLIAPNFSGAVFNGPAKLSANTFIDATFDYVQFEQGADFGSFAPREVHNDERKYGAITFSGARFEGTTSFRYAKFRTGEVTFLQCFFEGPLFFPNAEFFSDALFNGCFFGDHTVFSEVKFHNDAHFNTCHFAREAFFVRTHFHQNADLCGATFMGASNFRNATFGGRAGFNSATVEKSLWFAGATFSPDDRTEGQIVDFRNVIVAESASVVCEETRLQKALFGNSSLLRWQFKRVRWPMIGLRECVFDELSTKEKPNLAVLRDTYRDLRLNYEGQHDYVTAGEFHIGEMEVRHSQERGLARLLTRGYGLSSRYGEDYRRSGIVLLVMWILFVSAYAICGLELKGVPEVIRFSPSFSLSFLRESGFYDVALFSLYGFILRFPENSQPATSLGKIIQVVQLLFGPLQLALTILAIRRKYKK